MSARVLRIGDVVTEEQARTAITAANSVRGAARMLGVSLGVVRRWCLELGIRTKGWGKPPPVGKGAPPVQRDRVLAAVEAHPGSTSAELVALTGASRFVVQEAARRGLIVPVQMDRLRYYLPAAVASLPK